MTVLSRPALRSVDKAVRVKNGLGFTDDSIFIPPDLVAANQLNDEDVATGVANPSLGPPGGRGCTRVRVTSRE